MRSGKKFAALFLPTLFCLMALLVSACGSTTPTPSTGNQPASPDKQVLRIPIGLTDFGTLDPALVQLAIDADTVQSIFTGLVQFDNKINLKDQLAASHKVSADGLTYTFTLRSGLKFSDGSPLT